jgi:hypothetical protein
MLKIMWPFPKNMCEDLIADAKSAKLNQLGLNTNK